MTLDDALMWLNDRLGKRVTAYVMVRTGDAEPMVFTAMGELRHWSEGKQGPLASSRDDIRGLYEIGESASLDLSDIRPREIKLWPDADALVIRIDENTELNFVEQEAE